MARSRIRIGKDRVDEFKKRMEEIEAHKVVVGVLGEKAAEKSKGGGGITVGEIAVVHEFGATITLANGGTAIIPKRSFLREPIDRMRGELESRLAKLLMQSAEGKIDPKAALDQAGMFLQLSLVDGIRKGLPVEPLKKATVRRRARKDGTTSSTPLFNTGQLSSAIAHKVVERGEAE